MWLDLYVVRHAVAHKRDGERWPDDSERPLTPEGEGRFRRVAWGILGFVPGVNVVLSSPYERAWRTAEILAEAGWPAPKVCQELEPENPPQVVAAALETYAGAGSVAVVGHRPCLHELVSYLLTADTGATWVKIKKGGVVCLRFDGDGDAPGPKTASLRWLLTPKLLERQAPG